jgi:hypothetical protein
VDGAIAVKDLAAQRSLAVCVARRPEAAGRWQLDTAGRWHKDQQGRFVHRQSAECAGVAWIDYRHVVHGVDAEGVIWDDNPYVPNESRRLNRVDDVMLRLEVEQGPAAALWVRLGSAADDLRASIELGSGRLALAHNGRVVRVARLPPRTRAAAEVEFSVADRRALLAVDGRPWLEYPYRPAAGAAPGVLAVGASGGGLEVRDWQVLRDVYYTSAAPFAGQYRLAAGEYFLLGDNSPHSLDSRQWRGVPAALVIGPAWSW